MLFFYFFMSNPIKKITKVTVNSLAKTPGIPSGKVRRRIVFPHVQSPPRRSRLITEKSLIYRSIYQ
jgi:hypothetical protein